MSNSRTAENYFSIEITVQGRSKTEKNGKASV